MRPLRATFHHLAGRCGHRVAQLRSRSRWDALLADRADRPRQRVAARAGVDVSHRRARDAQRQREHARRAPSAGVPDDAASGRRRALSLHGVPARHRARRRDGARALDVRSVRGARAAAHRLAAPRRRVLGGTWARRRTRGSHHLRNDRRPAHRARRGHRTSRDIVRRGRGGESPSRDDRRARRVRNDVAADDLPRSRDHRRARARKAWRAVRAATSARGTRARESSCGGSTPCHARESPGTTRGSRDRGAIAPASTCGRS